MLTTDVVVAGGGVAGLLIASALAPHFSVTLLEQNDALPRNKYWLTDAQAACDNPHLQSCVDTSYQLLDFIAYDGLTATIQGKYCLWDTDKLIGTLERQLSSLGAKFLMGHCFYSLRYGKGEISVRANSETIKAKLLIDCMGFGSPIVGAKNVATISGYYVLHGREVPLRTEVRPVALDNVVVNRYPAFFELFPTSKMTAHAAIILPCRHYKPDRSLQKEFSFILKHSHYSDYMDSDEPNVNNAYFGVVPVGRLHQPALERIVFFGEAGQANPAASATGLTRMFRTYQRLADALSSCIRSNRLDKKNLLAAVPPYMTPMNRIFQETLFQNILTFNSDQFRRLVSELNEYPNEVINDLLFAEYDFQAPRTVRLALDAVLRRQSILGRNVIKSTIRFCTEGLF